ncbi:MAG: TatD family hydrolase [Saprospiraceae bacterium]|uniref:TatD family hydrolase n=1 Tax=Candidatus Opimibacter skivensis TaxID=2982028 RepID=A0A9D7SZM4_9BACT|nr:TatD family hydrolase [Candidatus Opimibacter skivensis]
MYWIDTHCHLFASEFEDDRMEMIHRALDSNVMQMMLPNIDMDSLPAMMALAKSFPDNCIPMLGLHPCSVKEGFEDVLTQMKIEIQKGGFYGIGETGVDLYWETKTKDIQIAAFEEQIEWGREFDLPIIIHSRETLDLTIDIINQKQDGSLRGIFHCFGGDYAQAMRIYELGFKIGIGGVITFKKSELGQLLPLIPSEIIVLETDAPYLAPVPHRGKRNESSYLLIIAEKIAQSLNLPLEEVAKLTTRNAHDVFGKKG